VSLRKAIRNARKASNYGIGKRPPQGISHDLTTPEGRAVSGNGYVPNIPENWDGSKIAKEPADVEA
jgi:hypothetical protein